MESYVNLETAKLLKEKGFHEMTNGYLVEYLIDQVDEEYPEGGGPFGFTKGEVEFVPMTHINENEESDNQAYETYSCPTLSVLQKWLREIHNIIVRVDCAVVNDWWYQIAYSPKEKTNVYQQTDLSGNFKKYEEALGEGLRHALKMINN